MERKLNPDGEPGAGPGPEQTGEPGAGREAPRSHLQRRARETADVDRVRAEDPDEQAAPAPVQPAAAAADVLPASSHGPPHDAKASKFNHESFQLPSHRCERNVSVSVWWDAATTPTTSTTPNERQKSRAFPREINVILH